MTILERVEAGLTDFRPKTHRQFVAFNIASRFDDLAHLARYLNVCDAHPRKVLVEAARLAEQRAPHDPVPRIEAFFTFLEDWQGKEGP